MEFKKYSGCRIARHATIRYTARKPNAKNGQGPFVTRIDESRRPLIQQYLSATVSKVPLLLRLLTPDHIKIINAMDLLVRHVLPDLS